MTIKVINPSEAGESEVMYLTGVKSCSDMAIKFYNGFEMRKRLCAKVDLLSLQDAPDDATFEERFEFMKQLGVDDSRYYIRMTKAEFDEIDLLTRI